VDSEVIISLLPFTMEGENEGDSITGSNVPVISTSFEEQDLRKPLTNSMECLKSFALQRRCISSMYEMGNEVWHRMLLISF
jgi:hypothetical protein